MKIIINGFLDDVYMSFLRSPVACCAPNTNEASSNDGLRPMILERHQPRLITDPLAQPEPRGREWITRSKEYTKRASSRGSFAVKRHLNAYNGFQPKQQRRPQISAPIDFRHVDHAVPRAKKTFRPLELSIYAPENQLSPIMPHFGNIDDMSWEKELPAFPHSAMTHSRSESALSHRIPRKPIRSSSHMSMDWSQSRIRPDSFETRDFLAALESELPQLPAPARLRSMTAPASYERVRTALQEKRGLEQKLKDIEEVIEERKSIYMASRPTSRATSRARSAVAEITDPLPPLSTTTSFANRINSSPTSDSRPNTASSKPFHIPIRAKSFSEASAAFTTPAVAQDHPLPPPPLPLILRAGARPPLRKKKSFSRVSNWLFPSDQHSRNTSLDSVTNAPKAVTPKDGFYQCVMPRNERGSFDTDLTVSTLQTDTEEEQPSPPTTWSPQSTPGREQIRQIHEPKIRNLSVDEDSEDRSLDMTRVRTFGEKDGGGNIQSWELGEDVRGRTPYMPTGTGVGVAF